MWEENSRYEEKVWSSSQKVIIGEGKWHGIKNVNTDREVEAIWGNGLTLQIMDGEKKNKSRWWRAKLFESPKIIMRI